MDPERVARECWQSVSIAWTGERWLYFGVAIAAIAYPLWVAVTGAAVFTIVDVAGLTVTLAPWSTASTALAVALGLLWIVGPAGIATYLVHELLTNPSGNLKTCYRVHHPLTLFALPVAVLAVGFLAGLAAGASSTPVLALLLAGGVYVAVRTGAYAARVFALSLPWVGLWVVFLGSVTTSVALLDRAAGFMGRTDLASQVSLGLAGRLGIPDLAGIPTREVAVAGLDLPFTVAAALVASVVISILYVTIQLTISSIQRVRRPTVKRSRLRTGQRHPSFARTTVGAGGSRSRSNRPGRRASSTASSGSGTGRASTTSSGSTTRSTSTSSSSTERRSGSATPTDAGGGTADARADEGDGAAETGRQSGGTAGDDAGSADASESAESGFPGSDDRVSASDAPATVFGSSDGAVFGAGSGAEDDGDDDPDELVCRACDRTYEPDLGRSFCPNCGARLQQR